LAGLAVSHHAGLEAGFIAVAPQVVVACGIRRAAAVGGALITEFVLSLARDLAVLTAAIDTRFHAIAENGVVTISVDHALVLAHIGARIAHLAGARVRARATNRRSHARVAGLHAVAELVVATVAVDEAIDAAVDLFRADLVRVHARVAGPRLAGSQHAGIEAGFHAVAVQTVVASGVIQTAARHGGLVAELEFVTVLIDRTRIADGRFDGGRSRQHPDNGKSYYEAEANFHSTALLCSTVLITKQYVCHDKFSLG
jgi:hypothetical protein